MRIWRFCAVLATAALTSAAMAAGASAQSGGLNILGAWSAQSPAQGGMANGTDAYYPNGNYVSVLQEPNGTMQRIWGTYQTTQVSTSQLRLDFHVQNWAPHQICAQAPGFPTRCSAYRPPFASSVMVTFLSPDTVRVGNLNISRDPFAPLLQRPVPDRLVLAARAPVQPYIRQPQMPGLHPYQPPRGPGSVGAMRQDTDNQQYRICAVNGGQVVRLNDGTLSCVH
jgi:hypothetical protein